MDKLWFLSTLPVNRFGRDFNRPFSAFFLRLGAVQKLTEQKMTEQKMRSSIFEPRNSPKQPAEARTSNWVGLLRRFLNFHLEAEKPGICGVIMAPGENPKST